MATRKVKALIDRKNRVIMDWNAKAGCTISVRMFFDHMGILKEALEYSPWIHNYRVDIKYENDPTTFDDIKSTTFFKFKIVRDPYARVVSSYIHAMKNTYEDEKIKSMLGVQSSDISFADFIKYLSRINLKRCNAHHRMQKEWYESDYPFDKICKLENIDEEMKEVNRLAGTFFTVSDKSSPHHAKRNTTLKDNVSERRWSEIAQQIPAYSLFYNKRLVNLVSELYHEDLQTYNYTFEGFLKRNS